MCYLSSINLLFNYSLFQNLIILDVDDRLMDSEDAVWEGFDWVNMAHNLEQWT
jgi:hypothetical protein